MSTPLSALPAIDLPFPKSEYESRHQRVLEAMARAGLDALVVTAHGRLRYLTGYDGRGGYFAPFPLIIVPGRAPTFVIREYEIQDVQAQSCIDDFYGYVHQQDFAPVCASVLKEFGLERARVGFELGCWNLAPRDVTRIQAQLPAMDVVDATALVGTVLAVKSELEIQVMRETMSWTDLAVCTFQTSLREGVSELEVLEQILAEVEQAGGQIRVPSHTLVFGERTKLPHGGASKYRINNNEPAMIEIGGQKHGYCTNIVRSAVLGRHAETEELHAVAVEVVEAVVDAFKPGVTAAEVDAACRGVLERIGRPHLSRQRTGYQTGIHATERGNISLEPGADDVLEKNMTFHVPFILHGESGHLFGVSEHVLLTENGAESLSHTPHTLFFA